MTTRTLTLTITIEEETLEEALSSLDGQSFEVDLAVEDIQAATWPQLRNITKVVCDGVELHSEMGDFTPYWVVAGDTESYGLVLEAVQG